jgi:hypothetical protein
MMNPSADRTMRCSVKQVFAPGKRSGGAIPFASPCGRREGGGTLAHLLAVMQTDLRRIEVALRKVAIQANFLDAA